MLDLVVLGGSLAFSRDGLISIPELASALLSFFARAQMLVTGLGPYHAYLIRYVFGPQ